MPGKFVGFDDPVIQKCARHWITYMLNSHGLDASEPLEDLLSVGSELTRIISISTGKSVPEDIPTVKALSADALYSTPSHTLSPFGRRNTASITSISPNHDIIAKNLFYLRTEENVSLKNISASDIVDGNMNAITCLVYSLFSLYIRDRIEVTENKKTSSTKDILLHHLKCLEKYTRVRNIRAVQDNVTLCALLAHYAPEHLSFESISKDNKSPAQNIRKAFSIMANRLLIPMVLDFSDLLDSKTSEKALIFFLGTCIVCLQKKQLSGVCGSSGNENEIYHVNSKVQLIEKKIEQLNVTAQRLSSGFGMVLASGEALHQRTYRNGLEQDSELDKYVSGLELHIESLLSFALDQDKAMQEIIAKQDRLDKILESKIPSHKELDSIGFESLKENYILLVKQNNFLRHQNEIFVADKKGNEQSKAPASPSVAVLLPEDDDDDKRSKSQKKKKSSALRRKTVSLRFGKNRVEHTQNIPVVVESPTAESKLPAKRRQTDQLRPSRDEKEKKSKRIAWRRSYVSSDTLELAANVAVKPSHRNDPLPAPECAYFKKSANSDSVLLDPSSDIDIEIVQDVLDHEITEEEEKEISDALDAVLFEFE